jgi:hypothetical protein
MEFKNLSKGEMNERSITQSTLIHGITTVAGVPSEDTADYDPHTIWYTSIAGKKDYALVQEISGFISSNHLWLVQTNYGKIML